MSRLPLLLALAVAVPILAEDPPSLCSAKKVRIEIKGSAVLKSSVEKAVAPWWKIVPRRSDADGLLTIGLLGQYTIEAEYRDLRAGVSRKFRTGKYFKYALASEELGRQLVSELEACDPDGTGGPLFGAIDEKAQAHLDKAVLLHQKGDYPAAVREWKRYLERDPENSYGHANLGVSLLAMEKWSDAATAFERSVRLNRHNDIALYNLGFAYWKLGRIEQSRQRLKEVLKMNPEHEQAARLLAVLNAS